MQRALIGLSLFSLFGASAAQANPLALYERFSSTDWTEASISTMRDAGTGTLELAGVTGTVTSAFLYWHGPTNSADPLVNANVSFGGTAISGTQIGFADSNAWSTLNSQAYRADVTALVTGNGSFALAGFENTDAKVNGASLVVTFDDGDASNNRNVTFFDGNDSLVENATYGDDKGWNIALPAAGYTSGDAFLTFFVSDGQAFIDEDLKINGQTIAASPSIFDGVSLSQTGNGVDYSGGLWDVRTFDVTSFLAGGATELNITMGLGETDRLSLISLALDVQAAPVPEPSALAMMLAGLGLTGFAARRRKAG